MTSTSDDKSSCSMDGTRYHRTHLRRLAKQQEGNVLLTYPIVQEYMKKGVLSRMDLLSILIQTFRFVKFIAWTHYCSWNFQM